MNIVFFGSGLFALNLAKEIHNRFVIKAVVVTKPKPRGRGRKIEPSEIVQWAQEKGVSVHAPDDPNTHEFIRALTTVTPDLFVLASYGHILGSELLNIPQYGGINVHPSLLPEYRGAAPIQRALMNGESKTGVSVILMDEKIDHGDIVFQQEVGIQPDDTYGTLLERLCSVATNNIGRIIDAITCKTYVPVVQDHSRRSYAPKIKKEETKIVWDRGVSEVHDLIRALSPYPGARTRFRGVELQIVTAHRHERVCEPGTIFFYNKGIAVGTGDGSIVLDTVKPANKRTMSGIDFKNGYRVKQGEVME